MRGRNEVLLDDLLPSMRLFRIRQWLLIALRVFTVAGAALVLHQLPVSLVDYPQAP